MSNAPDTSPQGHEDCTFDPNTGQELTHRNKKIIAVLPDTSPGDELEPILDKLVTNAHNHTVRGNSTDFVLRDIAEAQDRLNRLMLTREREARIDEVRNTKVVHMDMPTHEIKKRFDDWCFIRQEEITDGKPARYQYDPKQIDDYRRKFKS